MAVPLEGIAAVYHRASGQTHLLAQPLPELIAALDEGPADEAELLARLDLPADAESRAAVGSHLAQLEAIGLVARG